ncbi:MAG: ribosome maturation factor RimP [Termitinemataceae bacterium]|nr:MAG: ribosome maturation factor RimP [Termitinemataceae bacterium]
MNYSNRSNPLFETLSPVVRGLGLSLLELVVNRRKTSVQVRLVIYKTTVCIDGPLQHADVSIDDCSKVHRAVTPRLELAFPKMELNLEVSSPGIERLIKDASEFVHYVGRPVRVYSTEISDWIGGVLIYSDETHIEIKGKDGMKSLDYQIIAKAKLGMLSACTQTSSIEAVI